MNENNEKNKKVNCLFNCNQEVGCIFKEGDRLVEEFFECDSEDVCMMTLVVELRKIRKLLQDIFYIIRRSEYK